MQRNQSLDALRGFAILAMVLSGSIAFGILPAWMYHAQTPPPSHVFNPDLPGLSWVDLVFPFFLFSMGAAIPLAGNKAISEGKGTWSFLYTAARRLLLLTYFALFTVHLRARTMSEQPGAGEQCLSIAAFILLFFQLYSPRGGGKKAFGLLKLIAFLLAAALLWILPFKDGKGFSWYRSDIIIIVLANMAFFGTLIWWFTRENTWIRWGILPFIMAVFLGSSYAGSWNEKLFNWSPLPWMYRFYYLKYLFIIIPGTIAGDRLVRFANRPGLILAQGDMPDNAFLIKKRTRYFIAAGLLSFLLTATNTGLLMGRHLLANLFVTLLMSGLIYGLIQRAEERQKLLMHSFATMGAYLLLLGLFFEAYEGGIKKDVSTYSYYFVTAGLAFYMLIGLYSMQLYKPGAIGINFLSLNGKNPMVAYVAGNLLLLPLLNLTGLITVFNRMGTDPWMGFLRGVLFTGIVSLITVFFTKKGWLWKT